MYGIDSKMFVKEKKRDEEDILPLRNFVPDNLVYNAFDWIRNKCKNKWQHYVWGKYPERLSFYMSDLRSTDIGDALRKIDYDILHLHWINNRFIPLEKLPKDKPIVWTLHDSWPFTGGCHIPQSCKMWEKGCEKCELMGKSMGIDLAPKIFAYKKNL